MRFACLALLLFATGCLTPQHPDEEPFTTDRYAEMVAEDQARLLKIEERRGKVGNAKDDVYLFFADLYNLATGATPIVRAQQMIDSQSADERREALIFFSSRTWGREGDYIPFYIQLATNDPDPTVRAMALRALNLARSREALTTAIGATTDPVPLVRLEAVKFLANVPDERTATLLANIVSNAEENTDIRVAAADALRHFRNVTTAATLIRMLRDRDFAVAWEARQSLILLTGQDFRFDQAAWLGHISSPQPFAATQPVS